jgi:hypothetical protein
MPARATQVVTPAPTTKVLDTAIAPIPPPTAGTARYHRRCRGGHQIVTTTALNARSGHKVHYSWGSTGRRRRAITRLSQIRETSAGNPPERRRPARKDARRRADKPAACAHGDKLAAGPKTCASSCAATDPGRNAGLPVRAATATATRSSPAYPRRVLQHGTPPRPRPSRTASAGQGHRHGLPQVLEDQRAWCQVVALAVDPLAWLRHLSLDGDPRAEPKTLRYRLLHTAARIARANDSAG